MNNARETGEQPETVEQDEARVAQTETLFLGKLVERLITTRAIQTPATSDFLRRLDIQLNVIKRSASQADIARLKNLAWTFRREMEGSALAPKLNPADPIVREMGLE